MPACSRLIGGAVLLGLVACSDAPASPADNEEWTDLASRYPGDVGIEADPDVYFVETAEVADLATLAGHWGGVSASGSVALDAAVPPGSPGGKSIRLTTTAGPLGPGTARSAGLYHAFPGGLTGPVHVRWYVRYNTVGTFHHSGPRLGGNNPLSLTHANSPAGARPNGDDFFYVGVELSGAKAAPAASSPVDYYVYWMGQRGTSYFPGEYYGNSFINDPAVAISLSQWHCLELRFTPNESVGSATGALELWIDGVKVSDVRQGTLGTWTEDNFQPGPAGTAFEGFQWRNTTALPVNYLELLHFVDQDPNGLQNSVNYDHIVVARRYIGPLR